VLELGPEANDVEIKKKHRMLSILVHPDKNKHERAADAFNAIDQAYKTLMDLDKRRTFQRVMREAVEQVDLIRQKENERLKQLGRKPLPTDTRPVEI
jgi:curved DNA-binding protein CbpA